MSEEQIEQEKEEEVKGGEEEKEKKHHCKDVLDENSDDIYNLFKVVIPYSDAVYFAKIINALSFCLDEAYIYFQDSKGLFIRNMDPSHVVLGVLHIPYENLQEYETYQKYEHAKNQVYENYNLPDSTIFQVDLSSLKPLLSRARKDDALTLTLHNPKEKEETEIEKSYLYSELELTLEGDRGAKKEFSLTARSIDGVEGLTDLTLEHSSKIEFVADGLNEAVKDIAIIKPEFVFLKTKGIHSDKQVFIMKAEEGLKIPVEKIKCLLSSSQKVKLLTKKVKIKKVTSVNLKNIFLPPMNIRGSFFDIQDFQVFVWLILLYILFRVYLLVFL